MTYCVAIKLNAGLVFLSDSRTNAGLDHISTFRKMIVYERPGDRFMVLLSAGNLSISQSIREILQIEQLPDPDGGEPITIWNAKSMFDAARVLGSAVRRVYERDAASLKQADVDFNVSMLFGGQTSLVALPIIDPAAAGNPLTEFRVVTFGTDYDLLLITGDPPKRREVRLRRVIKKR